VGPSAYLSQRSHWVLVPLLLAFVVKTQDEGRKTVQRVLQNGALNNFMSACFVGKI
jgi:hypothetical protein